MAVFKPSGKHVLHSIKPCDLSSCTKRLGLFYRCVTQEPGIPRAFDIVLTILTAKSNLNVFFLFFSEIKKYFENSYDLYETLFTALKGQSALN